MSRLRKQRVTVGGLRATKIGAPAAFSDIYYLMMEISWPVFMALISVIFLLINLVFGLIYAALPGSVSNMPPGSVVDGFFFSVETLGTVGYGDLAPAGLVGHSVAAFEIFTGLFFSATITGLIFARFARPRDSLMFSNVAVIAPYEGGHALMVRVAALKPLPLADAHAQLAWLQRVDLPGGRVLRRLVDLPLVRDRNALLGLSWTMIHRLERDSDFFKALTDEQPFTLTATVIGVDTLLASQAIGGHSYRREQILIDHEFTDAISDVEGKAQLDLTVFHEARPTDGQALHAPGA